jgi:uncharacterized membrane protein YhaH (DUF805 family)
VCTTVLARVRDCTLSSARLYSPVCVTVLARLRDCTRSCVWFVLVLARVCGCTCSCMRLYSLVYVTVLVLVLYMYLCFERKKYKLICTLHVVAR